MRKISKIIRKMKNITLRGIISFILGSITFIFFTRMMFIENDFRFSHIFLTLMITSVLYFLPFFLMSGSPLVYQDYWYERKPFKNMFY